MLDIQDLHASVAGVEILKGFNMKILAFDIKDGIPVLIESKATALSLDEVDATR